MPSKAGKAPKVVKDMREAFDSGDVDIMSTATPNHWHALSGIWAMQAGKMPISKNRYAITSPKEARS